MERGHSDISANTKRDGKVVFEENDQLDKWPTLLYHGNVHFSVALEVSGG